MHRKLVLYTIKVCICEIGVQFLRPILNQSFFLLQSCPANNVLRWRKMWKWQGGRSGPIERITISFSAQIFLNSTIFLICEYASLKVFINYERKVQKFRFLTKGFTKHSLAGLGSEFLQHKNFLTCTQVQNRIRILLEEFKEYLHILFKLYIVNM